MVTEETIKDRLKDLVDRQDFNPDELIKLVNQLAASDDEKVRFSVDAGIIDRLGKELVARHETALSELVKNAYDADATTVDLVFENTDKPSGKLTIIDDGNGMNKEQLVNGFMRLSSSDKVHNPTSPIYKRTRAGRKGIGRFATQRLGRFLTVDTQAQDTDYSLEVSIDWSEFSQDRDLNTISSDIKVKPRKQIAGTTLIIDDLREAWTEAAIRRVYKYISGLLQPFPLSKSKKLNSEDSRFDASFWQVRDGDLQPKLVADENNMFYEHAVATIEGYVEGDGRGYWFMESNKLEVPDEIFSVGLPHNASEKVTPYKRLRNIHFQAYYFIYNAGIIPKNSGKYIRERLKEIGGIRVYRNGFRVLPYGEPNNDWLGLDESSAKREGTLAPHANRNFLGFVEIVDKDGNVFNELSSREGLFQDQAYDELIEFLYSVIIAATRRIAAIRGKKETRNQDEFSTPEKKLDNAISSITKIANEYESKGDTNVASSLRLITRVIEDAKTDQQQFSKELITEIEMLRVLASLGLTIGEFTHEIKYYLPAIKSDISSLTSKIRDNVTQDRNKRILKNMDALEAYTSYFDSVISQNVLRDKRPIELREAVNNFISTIASDLRRTGIELQGVEFSGYDIFTCPMHPSEWASILFNFYTNSKKAIKRAGVKGAIKISGGKTDSIVYLSFCDNGDGISEEDQENIFNAFFTTSQPYRQHAAEDDSVMGSGLGLKIVKDIVDSYGGMIEVSDPPKNYSTCILVEIPAATLEDYNNYDL